MSRALQTAQMVVAGAIIALVVAQVVAAGVSTEQKQAMEEFGDWCAEHDGELFNSNSIAHGGLHCGWDNGTTVHMGDVEIGGEGETWRTS